MVRTLGIVGVALAVVLAGCTSAPKTELPPEKEIVQDAVSSHVGDVSDCYTAALKKNPKLSGKLILEWDINPIGDPKNVKVVQGIEPKLDQCIAGRLSSWAFSPPPDGKIAKVRYPFVFAPAKDPVADVKTKSFETVATPPPSIFKKCPQIETEYAQLCVRSEDTGECVLDEKQMGEMLQLMRSSPKLPKSYLAELDKMLKNPKPSVKEAGAILAYLSEDCWTTIHMRMWNSIFHTFKNVPTHSRRAEAKEVLVARTTALEVPSPTLLALSQDLTILNRAAETGFIKLSAAAKKDIVFLRGKVKSLVKEANRDWGVKTQDGDMIPPTPTPDPSKVVVLVRKELKAVKPVRAQLKEWARKYWKNI